MQNPTNIVKKNQQEVAQTAILYGLFQQEYTLREQIEYARETLLRMPRSNTAIVDYLIESTVRYDKVFPKQITIARKVGLTSRTEISRKTSDLHRQDLVTKINRGYSTCEYRPAQYLSTPLARTLLGDLLPSLRRLSILLILSWPQNIDQIAIRTPNNITFNTNTKTETKNVPNVLRTLPNEVYKNGNVHNVPFCFKSENSQNVNENVFLKNVYQQTKGSQMTALPTHVQQLRNVLPLTDAALVEMSMFPENVIRYVIKTYKGNKKTLDNPFTWCIAVGRTFCKNNGINPDYKLTAQLREAYGYNGFEEKIDTTLSVIEENDSQPSYVKESQQTTLPKRSLGSATAYVPKSPYNGKDYVHTPGTWSYWIDDATRALYKDCPTDREAYFEEALSLEMQCASTERRWNPNWTWLLPQQKAFMFSEFPYLAGIFNKDYMIFSSYNQDDQFVVKSSPKLSVYDAAEKEILDLVEDTADKMVNGNYSTENFYKLTFQQQQDLLEKYPWYARIVDISIDDDPVDDCSIWEEVYDGANNFI